MKKISLSLLLLVFLSTAFATDVDKYEAYIIQLNKDTVRGFIYTNNLESVYLQINFESNDGTASTFKPGQIKRFAINVFDAWRTYTLLDLGEPTGLKDTSTFVFAQVLADEGYVKCYKYRCYQKKQGHFTNSDMYVEGARELITETCLIKGKDQILRLKQTSLFNGTKKQLKEFFNDCPTVVTSINNMRRAWEELPGLVRQYNRCSGKNS